MNPDLLTSLLAHPDPTLLAALIQTHNLTLDTIQWLKEHSAEFYASDPAKALQVAQLAHDLGVQLPAPAPALGRWTLGNAFMFVDRHVEADQLLQAARADYLALGNALDAARVSVGHIFVLAYLGQSERALALSAAVEPILAQAGATEVRDLDRLGGLLMNTAVAYELLGQYEEALRVYERLLPVAEALQDQLMLAQAQHNRAHTLVQLGSLTEALNVYQTAEQLFLAVDARDDLIRLYTNAATLLVLLAQYDDARQRLEQAEQVMGDTANFQQRQHWVILFRTQVALSAGWSITAIDLQRVEAALAAFTHDGPAFLAGLAWVLVGRCHLQRLEWPAAQAAFVAALHHAEEYADRVLAYRALHGQGLVAAAQQQTAPATRAYLAAIEQLEAMRGELQIETLRADFLTDKLTVYQDLIRLYVDTGQPTLAFQMVERAKSRLLTEKLLFRLHQESANLPPVEDEQVRALAATLQQTLGELAERYRQARWEQLQSAETWNAAPTSATGAAIVRLEGQVQSLTHAIQRQRPLFSAYASGEPAALASIQSHLADRLLLQYHINHGAVWVFLVNAQGVLGHYRLCALAEVEQARHAFVRAVERTLELTQNFGHERLLRYLPMLLTDVNQHLSTLYQLLIQPWAMGLASTPALVVVPDQALHYVPFHALFDGTHYLLENHAISYTPSATVLELSLQAPARGRGLLLLGYTHDGLAAIDQEMTSLQALLPGADCLLNHACRTDLFLQQAAQYRFLHLATHAHFRLDNPLLSALTLADRPLTLAEIAQLQLTADLVVLSACETGYGQLRGVDLLSLAGGFLSAGARSLLVSLWRVDDQITAQLMTAFYRSLLAGNPRGAALRQAQLALLQSGRAATDVTQVYCHPAFWAPFTLIGNWSALPDFAQFAQIAQPLAKSANVAHLIK